MKQTLTRFVAGAVFAGLALGLAAPPSVAGSGSVDRAIFLELADDDGLSVEVFIPKALIRVACKFDAELEGLCEGLELIQAVVLEFESDATYDEAARRVKETEKRLMRSGWIRMAMIRDRADTVSVLVLNDDETISGLAVMVLERRQLVFANIAGVLDLEELQRVGEHMDLPGLRDIDFDDLEIEGEGDR